MAELVLSFGMFGFLLAGSVFYIMYLKAKKDGEPKEALNALRKKELVLYGIGFGLGIVFVLVKQI